MPCVAAGLLLLLDLLDLLAIGVDFMNGQVTQAISNLFQLMIQLIKYT